MANAEERMRILKLVQDGKISPQDGVRLIEALGRRATLQWVAAGAVVLGLAATLLLEKSPQKKGMFPDNDTTGPPSMVFGTATPATKPMA